MSASTYDIVTVGSGHNGLVAAAYMAAAGKKVAVLERNPWFGGGVVTRELTAPGYRHDQHSMAHIFIQGNPLLKNDELKLKAKHGLKYVFPDPPMMSVFEDGTTLALYRDRERTCAEIAKFSKRDADAFRWLSEKAAGYMPMIASSLYTTPAPLGATYAMMDQSREGRELWRYMQMSSHDFLCQLFENDKVRMHFARVAGENLVSPDEKATGLGTFVFVGFLEAYGFGVPVGGSGRAHGFADREHPRERRRGAIASRRRLDPGKERPRGRRGRERRSRVRGEGRGDRRTASARLGLDGRRSRARGREGRERDADLRGRLHHRARGPQTSAQVPRRSHVKAVMIELLPNKYDTIRKSFDSIRYGEFSSYPLVGLGSLTMFDPSRAPAGAATMHAWDYVPYQRADGRGWDDTKHHYVKRMLNHMENFLDNLADNVLAYHSDSPVDMERTSSSFRRGDLHGIASITYQSGAHRPTPDLGVEHRAGLRAALPRRAVSASGRRRVRRGPRGGSARVRGPQDRLRKGWDARVITLYSADNSKLMEIERLERSGRDLLIRGKVFGAMPMTARLSPAEARKGLKLLNFKLAWFLLTFLLR